MGLHARNHAGDLAKRNLHELVAHNQSEQADQEGQHRTSSDNGE